MLNLEKYELYLAPRSFITAINLALSFGRKLVVVTTWSFKGNGRLKIF